MAAAAAAKSLQSCQTLCDPIDSSLWGFPVLGILHARTLEWVAISFSNAWKWKVKVKSFSHARLFVTPWTAAYQAPPSMGFSRQQYWSGVPLPSPYIKGNARLCNQKLESRFPGEISTCNLRHADDTTLMAESEEELKSLLVKEESGKSCLKAQPSEN